ncbi:hypothetical protein Fmac_023525 [Flemingia macrophylla]|uniref:Protein kinase domain-containing protein n=1 Tax=Flemingia macrophylla TaxID=520843 RepID=A0ABD1LLS8_9FABA
MGMGRGEGEGEGEGEGVNKEKSGGIGWGCSVLILMLLCLRKRKRTTPSSDPPHPYPYSVLRRATNSFSTRLGQGGFGPVFSGVLQGHPVAVKLMDSASLQGEREFHNELLFASRLHRSPLLVPPIGFSSDPKRRRFLLVYPLMPNGNLHDALLRRRIPHLTPWNNRFAIILDVARALRYLHSLHPPVIHSDVKPSNVLLDHSFSAKLADFGLARFKTHHDAAPLPHPDSESDAASDFDTQSQHSLDDAKGDYEEAREGVVEGGEAWQQEEEKKKKKKKKNKVDVENEEEEEEEEDEEEASVYGKRSVDSRLSGELRRARWNSYDSGKSGGVSSNPSTRGTVFYVAPEYGYSGEVSEKCDVYSFGVLLLVIVSGRRPLQMTVSEFQRANLVAWARQCGRRGKLLEVVDESVECLDKGQATLCVTVALMCLLKSSSRRPSMKEVLRMLTGEIPTPQLPLHNSHSPFKSRNRPT